MTVHHTEMAAYGAARAVFAISLGALSSPLAAIAFGADGTYFAVAVFALAALANRQRFFVAAMIRFIPSGLICRFGFCVSGVAATVGSDSPLSFAHRAFCAKAILLRDAGLNLFRLAGTDSGEMPLLTGSPESIARTSRICPSILVFFASNPAIAAVRISVVSFGMWMCSSISSIGVA
jgi:hypothetical protein